MYQTLLINSLKKIYFLIFIAFAIFLSGVCNHAVASQPLVITGNVTFQDGTIAQLATITIGNDKTYKQVRSNDSGKYEITDLPNGLYNLMSSGWAEGKAGMFTKTLIEITDQTKLPIVIDIVLIPPK